MFTAQKDGDVTYINRVTENSALPQGLKAYDGLMDAIGDGNATYVYEGQEFDSTDDLSEAVKADTPDLDATRAKMKADVYDTLEAAMMGVAGNPSPIEIASWDEKRTVAEAIASGIEVNSMVLRPTMLSYGVDAVGAARIILMRVRMFRATKAVGDIMRASTNAALDQATNEGELGSVMAGFRESLAERLGQLGQVLAAAKAGDMKPLEAAEKEITGT